MSVSWSVTDLATGLQASCAQIASYGVDIVQTDNSIVYFDNQTQSCSNGAMYSVTPLLQKGVYNGSLEFVSPNGTLISSEPVASFDVTKPGELAFARSFQIDDVCSHNRYFSLAWSADQGNITRPLSCQQTSGYSVSITVTNPPGTFDLSSSCDDAYQPNWYGVSADNVPPGTYSVTANLLDPGGTPASQTTMQTVTVASCSPGVIHGSSGVAFALP